MEWYRYLSGFGAGLFLTNFVPHFVKGICGDKFPTPFAKPPGKGLSSPQVNVAWSLFNLLVGYILFRTAHISTNDDLSVIVFFIAVVAFSLLMGGQFAHKDKE
jgi:hypothetical protein